MNDSNKKHILVWNQSPPESGYRSAAPFIEPQNLPQLLAQDLRYYCKRSGIKLQKNPASPPHARAAIRDRSLAHLQEHFKYLQRLPLNSGHPVRWSPQPGPEFPLEHISFSSFILRGQGHYLKGQPCQDATAYKLMNDCYLFAIADGVSQAPFAHLGSRMLLQKVVDALPAVIQRHSNKKRFLDADFLADVYTELYFQSYNIAKAFKMHVLDAWYLLLPTTIKVMIITPTDSIVFGLDDGLIVWKEDSHWVENLLPPRDFTEANIPPLLARGVANDLQQFYGIDVHANELALGKEAQSLFVYAYDTTASLMKHGILLCSDGVVYTHEMMPHARWDQLEPEFAFPLFHLSERLPQKDIIILALLYNVIAPPLRPAAPDNMYQIAMIRDAICHPRETLDLYDFEQDIKESLESVLPAFLIPEGKTFLELELYQILDGVLTTAHQEGMESLRVELIEAMIPRCKIYIKNLLDRELESDLPEQLLPLWDDVSEIYVFDREAVGYTPSE